MSSTRVWITGATAGIGSGLAATVPWPDAEVICIARREHPDLRSVTADLSTPAGWATVDAHLARELATFDGERAVFVHNAFLRDPTGFVGEVDPAAYLAHVQTNVTAPLVLGEAFLRHLPAGVEGGLVMVSSAAAKIPYAGRAAYGGGKAAMEQWVKAVRLELAERHRNAWAVAVRPGAVDTPAMRADAASDPSTNPVAPALAALLASGEMDTIEVAARRIWEQLPPGPDTPPVIFLGTLVSPPT